MEQQKQKRRSIYKHINLNPEYSEYRNLTSEINEAYSKAEHIGQILQAYNKCKCSCHKITLVLPLSILPRGCEQGTLTCLWISVWRHSSWRNEQTQSLLITPCQSLSLPQLPKAPRLIWTLSSSILLRQSSTKMQLGQEGGSRGPRQPQMGWCCDVLTGMGPEMQVAKKGLRASSKRGRQNKQK